MAASQLDRIVKGAPPPNVSPEQVASAARRSSTGSNNSITAPHPPPTDPTSNLPSSPPQIYLNLLILESSLRAQYLSLSARLRLHLVLLAALTAWTLSFTYLLFLRPREDGQGTGGSVYWMLDTGQKVCFLGGAITWCLVWGTGVWERGLRWPRKWLGITNRGLRGFNLKVVIVRGPWWLELIGYLNLLDPLGWWIGSTGMRFEMMPKDIERLSDDKERARRWEDGHQHSWLEEDIAPGGDVIKLLLLPKPFSPDFREDWDTYRTAYWDKENERRSELRRVVKARHREIAKRKGGWFWWTGWRGWESLRGGTKADVDMSHKHIREKSSLSHLRDRRKKEALFKDGGHSRSSSRSSTPTPEPESRPRRAAGGDAMRRGSSSQGTGRRKKGLSSASNSSTSSTSSSRPRPLTPGESQMSAANASSFIPTTSRPRSLTKRASNLSISSCSDGDVGKEEIPPGEAEISPLKEEDKPL